MLVSTIRYKVPDHFKTRMNNFIRSRSYLPAECCSRYSILSCAIKHVLAWEPLTCAFANIVDALQGRPISILSPLLYWTAGRKAYCFEESDFYLPTATKCTRIRKKHSLTTVILKLGRNPLRSLDTQILKDHA